MVYYENEKFENRLLPVRHFAAAMKRICQSTVTRMIPENFKPQPTH
jgi:hypothetical protein